MPVFVWLGHWLWSRFHADLEKFEHTPSKSQGYAFWGMLAVVVICGVFFFPWRRKHKAAKAAHEAEQN